MDNTIKVLNVINNKVNILQTTGINSGRRLTNISDYNDNVRWLQHRCVSSSATTASASTTTTWSVMETMIVVICLMNETATLLLRQVNTVTSSRAIQSGIVHYSAGSIAMYSYRIYSKFMFLFPNHADNTLWQVALLSQRGRAVLRVCR